MVELQQKDMEESIFLKNVGDSPRMRILQHFIEGRELEYMMTDLLESRVSWRTINKIIPLLTSLNIIKKTRKIGRATLYKLNEENKTAQQLTKLYDQLIQEAHRNR